jgi:hypothetical protein
VDEYLVNARHAWPHSTICFVEEVALCFLALKQYDTVAAIESIRANVDEIVNLAKTMYDRFHVSGAF